MQPNLNGTLAALADPTRRQVVDLLRRRPLCASEIAAALAMSRPAMSRHLRVLRKCGVVSDRVEEDDARVRTYQLRREPFEELRGWLDEVEAFWSDQLQAFKAHAEGKRRRSRR